jgi:sulfate transport system ATP-binding protein
MYLELKDVDKSFGDFQAVSGVSLAVREGELVALLGPSGSGKTTLLRIIAGLERPDRGQVLIGGADVAGVGVQYRKIGFVFQHYALFRHMTVEQNIGFGLRVQKPRPSAATIDAKVHELLRLVQMEGMGHRFPSQLSGGQRQRVALARALAIEPKALLLDEPFGALDAQVRKELRRWLRRLHDETGITGVFVTHDQEEALEVADRVVVMNKGRIEQVGTPEAIYDAPETPFVYQFLGNVNRLPCRIDRGQATLAGLSLPVPEFADLADAPGIAFVRPHDLDLVVGEGDGIPVTVRHVVLMGPAVRIETVDDAGQPLEVQMSRARWNALALGSGAKARATPRQMRVFPGEA